MTEDVRIDSHKKALTPEEHRKIEVLRATEDLDKGILEVRKRVDAGQLGIADLQHSIVFEAFQKAEDEELLTPETREAYHTKLQALFDEIQTKEGHDT